MTFYTLLDFFFWIVYVVEVIRQLIKFGSAMTFTFIKIKFGGISAVLLYYPNLCYFPRKLMKTVEISKFQIRSNMCTTFLINSFYIKLNQPLHIFWSSFHSGFEIYAENALYKKILILSQITFY